MSSFRLDLNEQGQWVWCLFVEGTEIARSATPTEHSTAAYAQMRRLRRGQVRLDLLMVDGGWSWKAEGPGDSTFAIGRVLDSKADVYDEIPRVFHWAAQATIERDLALQPTAAFWLARPTPV